MSARKEMPPLDRLRAAFRIDPLSPSHLAWREAGAPAGNLSTKGYFRVRLDGQNYAVHRIVWSLANDQCIDPALELDHSNGERTDNRPENLKPCTRRENGQNMLCNRSKFGMAGIQPNRGQWQACIWVNYKRIFLGRHPTKEAAHAANLEAKRSLHTFAPVPRASAAEAAQKGTT